MVVLKDLGAMKLSADRENFALLAQIYPGGFVYLMKNPRWRQANMVPVR